MPCEILITAVPKEGITGRGYPWIVKDYPCVWGSKEAPPNWVILRITDANKSQVEHFLQSWQKYFVYEVLAENDQGYRIKISVDPALISASGANKELRSDLKDHIRNNYNARIVSYDNFEAVVDIPKPVDLQAVKADIYDIFSERVDTRIYHFSNTDVDWALAQPGGLAELTKAEVLSRIINKVDE